MMQARKKALVEKEPVVTLDVKITLIVAVLFFFPVAMMFYLHSKPAVKYWLGDWTFFAALAVPIWILLCHFMLVKRALKKKLFAVLVIVFPAAFLAGVSQVQAWQFRETGAALLAFDCQSFLQKASIERSWVAASYLKANCTSALLKATGASPGQVSVVLDFEDCPGFAENKAFYGKDWQYLKHLERDYHCGGWCYPQPQIWMKQTNVHDSCSSAASRTMLANVSTIGIQVAVYSGVMLVIVCAIILFIPWVLLGED